MENKFINKFKYFMYFFPSLFLPDSESIHYTPNDDREFFTFESSYSRKEHRRTVYSQNKSGRELWRRFCESMCSVCSDGVCGWEMLWCGGNGKGKSFPMPKNFLVHTKFSFVFKTQWVRNFTGLCLRWPEVQIICNVFSFICVVRTIVLVFVLWTSFYLLLRIIDWGFGSRSFVNYCIRYITYSFRFGFVCVWRV